MYSTPTDHEISKFFAHKCEGKHEEADCDLACPWCGTIHGFDGYCANVNCPNYKGGALVGYLDMDLIAQYLREGGYSNAYVEMTGGGIASIYAGDEREDLEYGGTRYALIAGPGTFDEPSVSHVSDFSWGTDCEDQTDTQFASPEDDERRIADKMIRFLKK